MQKQSKIILGIDPGTNIMGYALLVVKGQKTHVIKFDVINLKNISNHAVKLKKIFDRTQELITEYLPDEMAIEAPFYGKNIQVMLKLGRAQGVAMAAALSRNIEVTEYSPRKIKQSITGNGNATKEQVAAMLQNLLNFKETPDFLDATDGLAVAVCHAFQKFPTGKTGSKKSYSGWDTFVKDNAKRII